MAYVQNASSCDPLNNQVLGQGGGRANLNQPKGPPNFDKIHSMI